MKILLNRKGQKECGSYSFPSRPDRYHHVELSNLVVHFSLGWRPLFAQGKKDWPNPLEWLRISLSGKRLYYAALGYGDLASLFDQYYVPCPVDGPEILSGFHPGAFGSVRNTLEWLDHLEDYFQAGDSSCFKNEIKDIGKCLLGWKRFYRYELARILKCRVNVLPPDTMYCDYDVLPLIVSTGCLQNCGFCTVKDGTQFHARPKAQIRDQLLKLKNVLFHEMEMFRGVFVGNLDALNAPNELLYYCLGLLKEEAPFIRNVFMFGSVYSLLSKSFEFFECLDEMGFDVFINIGIESLDQETLSIVRKPTPIKELLEAWEKINLINSKAQRVELSLNILANTAFPESHMDALIKRLRREKDSPPKGPIYLSPYNEPLGRPFFEMAKLVQQSTNRPVRLYNLIGL